MGKKLTVTQFIKSLGAKGNNPRTDWSFVNNKDKVVIFGAWDRHTKRDKILILSNDWRFDSIGRRKAGYTKSRQHIRLIEEEGYQLKTFHLVYAETKLGENGNGRLKIKSFEKELSDPRLLKRVGRHWYASETVGQGHS